MQLNMLVLSLILAVVNAQQCSFNSNNCKISCDNIQSGHPGHQAAQVAVDNYDNCDLSPPIFSLSFRDCMFPNDTFDVNWFEPETPGPIRPFSHLYFNSNQLFVFEDGAVATPQSFKNSLQKFEMGYVYDFPVVTAGLLQGLTNLSDFEFLTGYLQSFEAGVLSPVAKTLKSFTLFGSNPDITTMLSNATGICQNSTFPSLEHIFIANAASEYGIPVLSGKMFTGVNNNGNMFELSLSSSLGIQMFEDNTTLDAFGGELTRLSMSSNSLRTVPQELFYKSQQEGALGLGVFFAGNPWHCDCHLQYLQDMLRNTSDDVDFYDQMTCASPSSQAGTLVIDADLSTECEPAQPVPPAKINC